MKATACILATLFLATHSLSALAASAQSNASASMLITVKTAVFSGTGDFPLRLDLTLGPGNSNVAVEHCSSGVCQPIQNLTTSGIHNVGGIDSGDTIEITLTDSVSQMAFGTASSMSSVEISIDPGDFSIERSELAFSGGLSTGANNMSMGSLMASSNGTATFGDLVVKDANSIPSTITVTGTTFGTVGSLSVNPGSFGPLLDSEFSGTTASVIGLLKTDVDATVSVPEPSAALFLSLACIVVGFRKYALRTI